MKVGDRSRLVAGNEKGYPLAVLEVRPVGLISLPFMRLESDLDGVIEMLNPIKALQSS